MTTHETISIGIVVGKQTYFRMYPSGRWVAERGVRKYTNDELDAIVYWRQNALDKVGV